MDSLNCRFGLRLSALLLVLLSVASLWQRPTQAAWLNTPPTIAAVPAVRFAGNLPSTGLLANVADAEDLVTSLLVKVNNAASATVNGVTLSNLTVNNQGKLHALITVSCTATSANFTLSVTDSQGATAQTTYSITINPNVAPALSYNNAVIPLTLGTTAAINPATPASDNGAISSIEVRTVTPPLSSPITVGPTGIVTVNNIAPTGNHVVTIRVEDNCGLVTNASFTLSVTGNCPATTINPAVLPNPLASLPYNQTISATGGAAPYSYSLVDGALPAGLTLSAAGVLSGTPTVAGNAFFTVQAADANGCATTRTYMMIVSSCPTLTLSPGLLPTNYANQPFSTTFTASGGTAPYSYSVSAGSLPSGLSLNAATGVLSGTLTNAGTFNFSIKATAANGCTGTRSYSVTVLPVLNPVTLSRKGDFDGDGKTDLAVWTGATGHWSVLNSGNGQMQNTAWGAGYAPYNDVIVPGDYDGDGKADHAIWRGADSIWYIRKSSDGQAILQYWGANYAPYFDVPVPGDYDKDGKTDLAVWRPSTGTWFVQRSLDGSSLIEAWGQQGDMPVPGDYDGDGKTDLAVFRGQTGDWLIKYSAGGTQTIAWGAGYAPYFDVPVQADYDGDGKTDLAIWRGADSVWYIRKSSDGQALLDLWGANYAPYFDIPAPGDYDGDGRADIAVWRPADGTWFVKRSSNGTTLTQVLGQTGDTPVPAHGVK